MVSASALLPVAVGPRMATTALTTESAGKREIRRAAAPDLVAATGSLRLFVVEERDGEERLLRWIFRRQGRGWIRSRERAERGGVEGADRRGSHDLQIGNRAVLMHVEGHDHVA